MKCWICGEDGLTGEHRMKASDLKDHFGEVSQETPLYIHTAEKRNIPIGSIKNDRLKSNALLCANCNNSRTQPFDRSWEALSTHLRSNWNAVKATKSFNLSDVFPAPNKKLLVSAHLYFVKIFGCMIAENDIPIDIKTLSNCIIHKRPHRNIFISFGTLAKAEEHKNIAALTPVHSLNLNEKSVFASYMYFLNDFTVNVMFNNVANNHEVLKNSWHPNQKRKKIKIIRFAT